MATPTPDTRAFEFGNRFVALGLCLFNLALVFQTAGEVSAFAALMILAAIPVAVGIYFYWGERWAVPDPTPMEIANTGCLIVLLVVTGVGSFATALSATTGLALLAELVLAVWMGMRLRAHMSD